MQGYIKGISFRLAKVGIIIAIIVGTVMSSIQMYLEYNHQIKEIEHKISKVIAVSMPPATRAVTFSDTSLASEVISGLMYNDIISFVEIKDGNGQVLATKTKSITASKTSWLTSILCRVPIQRVLKLASTDGTLLGDIAYSVNMDMAFQPYYQQSALMISFGMIRSSLLVFILFFAYYQLVTKPLLQVANQIKKINPGSPGEQRINLTNHKVDDEITQLVSSANELLDSVDLALAKRKAVEVVLRKSEEHVRQIIDSLPVWVGARNKDGHYIFANQALADFFETTPEAMRGAHIKDFARFFRESPEKAIVFDKNVIKTRSCSQVWQERWVDGKGRERNMHTYIMPMEFYDETVALVVSSDITDLKRAQEQMKHMAYHDALTGLPNRSFLVERLEEEIERAATTEHYGALLFIDLDQFKYINDSLGHPAGDEVLKHVARRLTSVTKSRDLVVRLGGDEFVVVLTDLGTELQKAILKAEDIGTRIRHYISEPHFYNDLQLHVTCSVGIVMYPEDNAGVYELLRYADTAMYQVKEQGRDAIQFFNKYLADRARNVLIMEGDLHNAFNNESFGLCYQPRVNAHTGEIVGAEALLRWRHPERGMISPSEFIPILETSGLIVDVGKWIVTQAVKQVSLWLKEGVWTPEMRLGINISPRQFRSSKFVDDMLKILDDQQFDGVMLEMEITESIVIHNLDETVDTMMTLSKRGISFALDDFGTGYSSISYLKQLPVSTLKIDQSFVRDIIFDRNDRVLVETISAMGNMLDLDVVAEGVETHEQLTLVKQYRCQYYQGFLCSKPVDAKRFAQLITDSK